MTTQQQLTKLAEFIGKYFPIVEYGYTNKGNWSIVLDISTTEPLEILIEPFDTTNKEHIEFVIDKVATSIAFAKNTGIELQG